MRLVINCNRTPVLLLLALVLTLGVMFYFFEVYHDNKVYMKLTPRETSVGHIIGDHSVTHDVTKTSRKVRRNDGFLLLPALANATVISRSETAWLPDDGACDGDTQFVKTVLNSPGGKTPIYVHPKAEDVWVSGSIIAGGVWEASTVTMFYKLMQEDDSLQFLDVGGNIGVYGLTIAKLGRNVVFVEPLLKNVQKLCHSVLDGSYPQSVFVVHNAMSSSRFKVSFGTYKGNVGGTYVRNASSSSSREETAQAVLLDDILEVFNFKKIAMKLDVETHEDEVLAGAENFFNKADVRYLLLEWNAHKTDGQRIIDFLTRHKMEPYKPNTNEKLDVKHYQTWPGDIFFKKNV